MINKTKNSKSKNLTQTARFQSCIRCGIDCETRACHYNGLRQHRFGKGRGIKCHDLATAEFCHSCDEMYSEGSIEFFNGRDDRSERFMFWIVMTNIRRMENDILTVR